MSYVSFTILTTDAKELRDRLVAYGWLTIKNGARIWKEGVEVAEVPNPIAGDLRRVFLVKIAHQALRDDTEGEQQTDAQGNLKSILLRTKLGKFVAANSIADTVDGFPARRLGTKFWLVPNADRFGVWQ